MAKKYEPGSKDIEERKERNRAVFEFITERKGTYKEAAVLFSISRARAFQIVRRTLEKAEKSENNTENRLALDSPKKEEYTRGEDQ